MGQIFQHMGPNWGARYIVYLETLEVQRLLTKISFHQSSLAQVARRSGTYPTNTKSLRRVIDPNRTRTCDICASIVTKRAEAFALAKQSLVDVGGLVVDSSPVQNHRKWRWTWPTGHLRSAKLPFGRLFVK